MPYFSAVVNYPEKHVFVKSARMITTDTIMQNRVLSIMFTNGKFSQGGQY